MPKESKEIGISRIVVTINGKDFSLMPDEAKELRDALNKVCPCQLPHSGGVWTYPGTYFQALGTNLAK